MKKSTLILMLLVLLLFANSSNADVVTFKGYKTRFGGRVQDLGNQIMITKPDGEIKCFPKSMVKEIIPDAQARKEFQEKLKVYQRKGNPLVDKGNQSRACRGEGKGTRTASGVAAEFARKLSALGGRSRSPSGRD